MTISNDLGIIKESIKDLDPLITLCGQVETGLEGVRTKIQTATGPGHLFDALSELVEDLINTKSDLRIGIVQLRARLDDVAKRMSQL